VEFGRLTARGTTRLGAGLLIGSRCLFTYAVGGYTPDGVEAIAQRVDEVWAGHLAQFAKAVKTSSG